MLTDLFLQGRLPLDEFVTERIGIRDIERAFATMAGGDVLRSVVVM
jgi:S-(hydroxymethyl)mycothiol dehydrogenase